MNLNTLINQYITYRQSLGEQISAAADHLRAFSKMFKKPVEPNEISEAMVKQFLYQNSSIITMTWFKRYSALRCFFSYATGRGYMNIFPLPKALPQKPQSLTPYIYSREEVKLIFKTALIYQKRKTFVQARTIQMLLILLYSTGIRLKEALSITLNDIDEKQSILTINNTKFYKSRLVPFGGELTQILKEYLAWRQAEGYSQDDHAPLLVGKENQPLRKRTVQGAFKRILNKTNIQRDDKSRFHPRIHDFRHIFAVHRLTSWYKEGQDIQVLLPFLSVYLGHTHLAHTTIYLSMTKDLLDEASNLFEKYVIGDLK